MTVKVIAALIAAMVAAFLLGTGTPRLIATPFATTAATPAITAKPPATQELLMFVTSR